jgi:hypothetical protein
MKLYIKVILTIIGLYPIIQLFGSMITLFSEFVKILFCDHNYRYWNVHLKSTHSGINDTVLTKWRKCEKCEKQQELDMRPGVWDWKKSDYDLPEDTDTIVVNVKLFGEEETKSEKRERKIDLILKK